MSPVLHALLKDPPDPGASDTVRTWKQRARLISRALGPMGLKLMKPPPRLKYGFQYSCVLIYTYHIHTHIHMRIYIYMYISIYTYTCTERERAIERERERENKERERKRDLNNDKHASTEGASRLSCVRSQRDHIGSTTVWSIIIWFITIWHSIAWHVI